MRKKTVIQTLFAASALLMCVLGCSKTDAVPQQDDLVHVHFSAGDVATKTNAPFAAEAKVKVLAVQGASITESAVGTIASGTSTFTGCDQDLVAGTYDFYALVNAGNKEFFGSRSGKVINGFQHGDRILAAKSTKAITTEDADVDFGNMPHMEVALCASVKVDNAFITNLGPVNASLSSIAFSKCLPASASLDLDNASNYNYVTTSNDGLKFTVVPGAYNTSYVMAPASTTSATLASSSDEYVSEPGFILPCPMKAGQSTLPLDLTFTVNLGNGGTTLEAKGVNIPEFVENGTHTGYALYSGYKYTFNLQFNYVAQTIDLYLSVAPWESVTYNGAVGGYDAEGSYTQTLLVGSWQNVSYTLVIGGNEDDSRQLMVTAGTFKAVDWRANVGQY